MITLQVSQYEDTKSRKQNMVDCNTLPSNSSWSLCPASASSAEPGSERCKDNNLKITECILIYFLAFSCDLSAFYLLYECHKIDWTFKFNGTFLSFICLNH